jgi:hypothetical protein
MMGDFELHDVCTVGIRLRTLTRHKVNGRPVVMSDRSACGDEWLLVDVLAPVEEGPGGRSSGSDLLEFESNTVSCRKGEGEN